MIDSIETVILKSSASDIYLKIKDKSEELFLPCKIRKKFIGFGGYDHFYMFWVSFNNEIPQFNARINYTKATQDNVVRYLLIDENIDKIMNSIEAIHKNFTDIEMEIKPISNVNNTCETDSPNNTLIYGLEADLNSALQNLSNHLEEFGDKPIERITSTRVTNLFEEHQIISYSDLLNFTANQIRNWHYCGRKCIIYIICLINNFINPNEIDLDSSNITTDPFFVDKSRLQKILNSPFEYLEPLTSDLDIFTLIIEDIKLNFEKIIEEHNSSIAYKYNELMWKQYIFDETISLQDIGDAYKLSRERVRQIIKKHSARIRRYVFKNSKASQIIKAFDSIDDSLFMNFIAYGMIQCLGKRLTEFILSCFYYDSDIAVREALFILTNRTKEEKTKSKSENKVDETLLTKAIFPSNNKCNTNIDDISSKSDCLSFQFKENFFHRISQFETIKRIITNPELVYSNSFGNNYIPDFLIETTENKIVLVLVLPLINMAYNYNVKRFNDLHLFCKANGFGYIITTERLKTIYDIKEIQLDQTLVEELHLLLAQTGSIVWKDILKLKNKHTITQETIVAYVLQNKLSFSINPYVIKKRKGD